MTNVYAYEVDVEDAKLALEKAKQDLADAKARLKLRQAEDAEEVEVEVDVEEPAEEEVKEEKAKEEKPKATTMDVKHPAKHEKVRSYR